jgi:hypothetical protein
MTPAAVACCLLAHLAEGMAWSAVSDQLHNAMMLLM